LEYAEKMLEEMQNNPLIPGREEGENLMALPEVQAQVMKMASEHWKAWLDTPLPALKEQTPREATKTRSGRERLEALLLQFESRQGEPQPFDPDLDALRLSLGLD